MYHLFGVEMTRTWIIFSKVCSPKIRQPNRHGDKNLKCKIPHLRKRKLEVRYVHDLWYLLVRRVLGMGCAPAKTKP